MSSDGRLVQIPCKLYKFRALSDWSLAGLTNGKFFFSAAERFNDPFDSQFDLIDEDADRLERIEWIRSLESRGLSPPGFARMAETLYDHPGYAFERSDETPRDEYRRRRMDSDAFSHSLALHALASAPTAF